LPSGGSQLFRAVWVPFVVAGGAMMALMLVPLQARAFRTLSLRADD
jgi:hypothetical protein